MSNAYCKIPIIEDAIVSMSKGAPLNSVIKVHVVLAKEMIQFYAKDEMPNWIRKQLTDEIRAIPVLKSYRALDFACKNLPKYNNESKIPIIINHTHMVKDINDPAIVGWVKNIRVDSEDRKLVGVAYFITSKLSNELRDRILSGDIIDVSVGGSVLFDNGGFFDNVRYLLEQSELLLNHLALLPQDQGRCPSPTCGINIDSSNKIKDLSKEIDVMKDVRIINHIVGFKDEYNQLMFDINKNLDNVILINESEVNNDNLNDFVLNDEIETQIITKELSQNIPKTPEELKLQAILDENKSLKSELKDLKKKDFDKQVTDLSIEVKDSQLKITTLEKQVETKDKDLEAKDSMIEKLTADLKDANDKLNLIEKEKVETLKKNILDSKQGWTEDEIKDMEFRDLNNIMTTINKSLKSKTNLKDVQSKVGFSKPDEKKSNQSHVEEKSPLGHITIDMNKIGGKK